MKRRFGHGKKQVQKSCIMTELTLGIRREGKSRWERRVPLSPTHVATLIKELHLKVIIQSSSKRVYTDNQYRQVSLQISVQRQHPTFHHRQVLSSKMTCPALTLSSVWRKYQWRNLFQTKRTSISRILTRVNPTTWIVWKIYLKRYQTRFFK